VSKTTLIFEDWKKRHRVSPPAARFVKALTIEELNLPIQIQNVLLSNGIKTLGALSKISEEHLAKFPGMGTKSIEFIRRLLNHYSLTLTTSVCEGVTISSVHDGRIDVVKPKEVIVVPCNEQEEIISSEVANQTRKALIESLLALAPKADEYSVEINRRQFIKWADPKNTCSLVFCFNSSAEEQTGCVLDVTADLIILKRDISLSDLLRKGPLAFSVEDRVFRVAGDNKFVMRVVKYSSN
jgi:hypothetical protein